MGEELGSLNNPEGNMSLLVSPQLVMDARERISGFTHRTPIFTSMTLDEMAGGLNLYFKAECLQKTGSFKSRGAVNAVSTPEALCLQ